MQATVSTAQLVQIVKNFVPFSCVLWCKWLELMIFSLVVLKTRPSEATKSWLIKFVENNTTAYRIWQSFQTDIHLTCTEQVTSLYNRINTLRLFFGCMGLYLSVYWSLNSINVLGQNKSHWDSFDIYEDHFCINCHQVITLEYVIPPINLLFWWYYFQ